MRLHRLVGLACIAVATRVDSHVSAAGSAVLEPHATSWSNVQSTSETSSSATRFLRARGANDDEDEEERAGFSGLATLFKPTQAQLQKMLSNGESADDVFTQMKLNKAGDLLLHDDELVRWLKYVDDLKIKHPTVKTSAIATLTAHYGEEGLYKLIEAGLKNGKTEKLATRLKTELMKHWVATGKDPDKVFHIMELDKAKKTILGNPEFTNWAQYLDNFNAKYPDQPTSMVPTLLNYYSDEVIFKMTETAKSVEETKAVATKLQEQLVQAWLKSKKTPDDALIDFGLGKKTRYLDKPDEAFLEKSQFNSWAKYVDAYNIRYPEKETSVIETLTRKFGDENVAKMLVEAKTEVVTRSLATKLESAQLEMWLSSGKSVEDAFKLLKLDYPGLHFTENPLVNTWVSYMNILIKEDPSKATTVLLALETILEGKRLGYILLLAKKYPSMESAVTEVQTKTIHGYLVNNVSPKKAFDMLALEYVGDSILSNPLFHMWMKYVKDFNKKNPKLQESWFFPLRVNYMWFGVERMIEAAMKNPSTVKIAKLVEREWLKYWLDEKQLPMHAFRYLHLDKTGTQTLASPRFKTWAKYLNDFNQRYPKQRENMLDALRESYYDKGIVLILNAAKQEPNTKNLAANLESALINKWVAKRKKPADLESTLYDVPTADNIIARYVEKLKSK